jgi:conjugative relaxase-like TrwC/TraI family protein
MLGLEGAARAEDFDRLCDNLHPQTGLPLTTHTRDCRRVGMDLTFNSTKSVGIARELGGPDNAGDPRVEEAHREAVAYTMKYIEADMKARVRVGGKNEDRVTANMVAYRVTHRDTRISAEDQLPDMSLHDHVFVVNATYDKVEHKWKAAQMGDIKHDAPYYEAAFHNRLASNLKDLGYGIRRDGKAFEIQGISRPLIEKFSRRRQYIEMVAKKLGITNPATMSKLGATTRLGKTKELADDLNAYWKGRLTESERGELQSLMGQPSYQSDHGKAVAYAIGHMFERKSVVDERRLYETALRHGIGSVTPEGVMAEARRQGLLVKAGEATTKDVLAEEGRMIAFARDGRGTMRPMGSGPRRAGGPLGVPDGKQAGTRLGESPDNTRSMAGMQPDSATLPAERQSLSHEQLAIARHVWESTDRVILIRGAAGTGKTRTMQTTIAGIDKPVVVLAPSAEASRGVLRREGFADADTVARFLQDEEFQKQAEKGVIWVDEAGLLGVRQTAQIMEVAERLQARVVLQGDKRQHGAVERGATLRVLEEFAGLPVAELRDIRRQSGEYKKAVAALAKGDMLGGYDKLDALGWVREVPVFDHNKPLVDDYFSAVDGKKSALVVAPTHAEADEITGEIRNRMKQEGKITDEREFKQYRNLGWTEAQKGDTGQYDGTEMLQFHRNSGTFKAGQQVRVADWKPGDRRGKSTNYVVYAEGPVPLAVGDTIRITANGRDLSGEHKLDNGSQYGVAGFTKEGDITLDNGWVVSKEYGHLTHGYVTTSHASQGKTIDRVFIAMGNESRPAINAEQFYVSVSRGREKATIYTDMSKATMREAIQKMDARKSASELMGVKPKRRVNIREKIHALVKQIREHSRRLYDSAGQGMAVERQQEREARYGR